MLRKQSLPLSAALVAILLVSVPASGDGPQTATIDGHVVDAEGQPLPGVTISLSGPQVEKSTIAGEDGGYRFALLTAGPYTVGAMLEGFGSTEQAVTLEPGARRGVDLTLGSDTKEQITVISEAPLVSKYQIAATAALESEVAESMAFRSRLYSASVRMLPGVINKASSGAVDDEDNAPAFNGGGSSETGAFLEGVDTSITQRGGELRLAIPTTAVSETRIEGAGFGAEYGRSVSGVINTTIKTGTNAFHGEGLYTPQNRKWRAAYKELDIERPDDRIDSFEASLGGPLWRDRAWFFAAYSQLSSNELDQVPSGDVVDTSQSYEPTILKLNFQPGERHQVTLTGIDSPSAIALPGQNPGDIYSLGISGNDQSLYTGTWSYALTSKTFLEVKASTRQEDADRAVLARREIDPAASPDSPLGNNYRYIDLTNDFRYNALAFPTGTGFNEFPRDQANAALTRFLGHHELRLGLDYQDVAFNSLGTIGQEYRGRGFDVARPGGFATPSDKRIYAPSSEIENGGETVSAFAQDRIELGDRWTVTYGLRLDDQLVENEIGEDVASYTKVAPRLSAVYDVHGDGRILARATAGRYYSSISLALARTFARLSSGSNEYDEFAWNAVTQRYDRFLRHQARPLVAVIPQVDPIYKDEMSAGVDWQLDDAWVLKTRLIWHQMGDLFWVTDQFDGAGSVVTDVRNWEGGDRDYRALMLEANRAFRGGWAVRTNYTLGKAEANVDITANLDDLFEALGGVEVGTARTDATIVNREGRTSFDRQHVLNLLGLKRWELGAHDVSLGAYYFFRSGERWGLRPNTTVAHPVSGQRISTTTYREPRDAQQLEDIFNVNLSVDWTFPIAGQVRGRFGAEAANLTDEQEIVVVNITNGEPSPGVVAYQVPRELRLKIGVSF